MHIALITPAPPLSRLGNRNTAQRWAFMLKKLGQQVTIQQVWDGSPYDLMLALHARRSYASIKEFALRFPTRPLIVALTGTDLYRDIQTDAQAQESLQLAHQLVVLQELGLAELSPELRQKTRVIYQSAKALARGPFRKRSFDICVIGHLRDEKDPFRCALASQHLPSSSKIKIRHMGKAMTELAEQEARALMARLPRYRWYGELPQARVRQELARCRLMVISSKMEGGANVVSEALSADVPIIASNISGNVGMLGPDYLGYYPLGNETALATALSRAESDKKFYEQLQNQCRLRAKRITPEQELAGLKKIISFRKVQ